MGEPVDGTLFYGYCWREDDAVVFDEERDVSAASALVRESIQQCEIGWYGVDGHEGTFVHIVGTDTCAGQFNPEPVDLGNISANHAANHNWRDAMLNIFINFHGVKPPNGVNQPGWWLVSRYCS